MSWRLAGYLTMKPLTPVHISAGNEEHAVFHVVEERIGNISRLYKYDFLDFFDVISEDKERLRELDNIFLQLLKHDVVVFKTQLQNFVLKYYKQRLKPLGVFSRFRAQMFSPFIKDGLGRPLLPGSSLKGALLRGVSKEYRHCVRFVDISLEQDFYPFTWWVGEKSIKIWVYSLFGSVGIMVK